MATTIKSTNGTRKVLSTTNNVEVSYDLRSGLEKAVIVYANKLNLFLKGKGNIPTENINDILEDYKKLSVRDLVSRGLGKRRATAVTKSTLEELLKITMQKFS